MSIETMLAEHLLTQRAIESVWRQTVTKRPNEPVWRLSELCDAVLAKSPDADRKYVADIFKHKIEKYRPRRRGHGEV